VSLTGGRLVRKKGEKMQIKNVKHLAEYLSYCLGEDLDFGVYVNRSPEKIAELLNSYNEVSAMEDWYNKYNT